MKNNIEAVAQTIAKEISKFPADQKLSNERLHGQLGYTKRQSEAVLMATYFLKTIEKINPDLDESQKEDFDKYHGQLVKMAIEITGK